MTVEHVVVLMMENRSFDHLLGFLEHPSPEFPRLRAEEPYANPVNPLDPDAGRVTVTPDAEPLLAHDPPHSHASVLEQLGVPVLGEARMDGFVAAYSRKLAGQEGRPVIHWGRIVGLVLAVLVLGAALCALRSPCGALVVAGALEAVALTLYRLRPILPPFRYWGLALVAPGVCSFLAWACARLLPWAYPWRVFALVAVVVAAGLAVLVLWRRFIDTPPAVPPGDARHVMRCMDPAVQLPALARLATEFAVCTRWHASVPGATWPNRTMVHAGTADNTVDNEIRLYSNDTVFERLAEAGRTWRIYRDPGGLAQVMAFGDLWRDDADLARWHPMADFAEHVAADDLPTYSFIEPCHDGAGSNSQHPGNNTAGRPGSDFVRGDQLIASVYEALRAAPAVFAKTALIITYDEHGGFYDHVPPPRDFPAPSPLGSVVRRSVLSRVIGWFVEQPHSQFGFRLLGPRVPTVVVSPLVAAATCDDTLYDHTSVPATLRRLYAPGSAPLSVREGRSGTLEHLWALAEPRTDLPDLSDLVVGVPLVAADPGAAFERDDQFARQLRALGELVRDELRPRADRPRADRPRAAAPATAPADVGTDADADADVGTIAEMVAKSGADDHDFPNSPVRRATPGALVDPAAMFTARAEAARRRPH